MLTIALLSMPCGGECRTDTERFGRARESFLRGSMTLNRGAPSHDAFSNPFDALEPQGLQRALLSQHGRTQTATGTRYYIMSAKLTPERRAARRHWALDTTMNEDRRRNRTGHGPENPALMRRTAPNIVRNAPGKDAMRGEPKRAGRDNRLPIDMIRAADSHRQNPA